MLLMTTENLCGNGRTVCISVPVEKANDLNNFIQSLEDEYYNHFWKTHKLKENIKSRLFQYCHDNNLEIRY